MKREILINGSQRETRVAILEDDRLVELLVDRPDHRRIVGDIYLGKVEAVLPGIQAAFVDIGLEKSAFLHASDLLEPEEDEEPTGEEGDEAFEEAADAAEGDGKGRGKAQWFRLTGKAGSDRLRELTRAGASALKNEAAAQCPRCGSSNTEEISRFGSTPCKALWRCKACAEPFDRFKCH